MEKEKSFCIHKNNGFALKLPNGIRISTIFGYGNYCENYNWENPKGSGILKNFERIPEGSNDVEIMISCPDEKWLKRINRKYNNGGDNPVIGYLTIDKWFEILKKCWNWKPKVLK